MDPGSTLLSSHTTVLLLLCAHTKNSAFRAGLNVLICKSLWDNLRSYIGEQRCICLWSTQLAVFHENCNLMEHLYAPFLLRNGDLLIHMLKYTKFFCYISEFENLHTMLPAIWNMHTHRHIYCVYHCIIVFV